MSDRTRTSRRRGLETSITRSHPEVRDVGEHCRTGHVDSAKLAVSYEPGYPTSPVAAIVNPEPRFIRHARSLATSDGARPRRPCLPSPISTGCARVRTPRRFQHHAQVGEEGKLHGQRRRQRRSSGLEEAEPPRGSLVGTNLVHAHTRAFIGEEGIVVGDRNRLRREGGVDNAMSTGLVGIETSITRNPQSATNSWLPTTSTPLASQGHGGSRKPTSIGLSGTETSMILSPNSPSVT